MKFGLLSPYCVHEMRVMCEKLLNSTHNTSKATKVMKENIYMKIEQCGTWKKPALGLDE